MQAARLVSMTPLYLLLFSVSWKQVIGSFLSTGMHFDVNLPGFQDVTDVASKRELVFDCQPFKKIGCFDKTKAPMLDMTFMMDNVNGNETLAHDLLCLCSSLTTDLRIRYFAIANNECYYGDVSPTANVDTLNNCKDWSDQTQACDETTTAKCVGHENSTYVYENRIDGIWTQWGEWSACSATCGNQNQIRTRTCTDPAPSGDGSNCVGDSSETKACPETVVCPAIWSQWEEWSACSPTCGIRNQIRTRTCTNSENGNCVGSGSETKACPEVACPPTWSQWGEWSACSASCGNQNQIRTRTCTNSENGNCAGSGSETKACPVKAICVVNGGYSAWKKIHSCDVQCGLGHIKYGRTCTNPTPSGGGKDCSKLGEATKSFPCLITKCPVDCNDKKCAYYSISSSFKKQLKKLAILPKCMKEATRMKCPKLCGAC